MKNEEFNFDILMLVFEDKKTRESIINDYIEKERECSLFLIDKLSLKRMTEKYIKKTRLYNKNSYSKGKIREEEQAFCEAIVDVLPIKSIFDEQESIYRDFNLMKLPFVTRQLEEKIYFQIINSDLTIYDAEDITNTIIKTQDVNKDYKVEVYNLILESSRFRSKIINLLRTKYLLGFIIEQYKLTLMEDIYIKNIDLKMNSSYQRKKLKTEEIFLIKKVYQLAIFITRIMYYEYQEETLNEKDINCVLKHYINTKQLYEYYVYSTILSL